jgi:hypothetical protein
MSIVRNIITGVVGVGIVSAGAWALDNTKRDDNGAIVESGDLGVFNFAVGDCITGMPEGATIDKATGTPCDQPHEYEVYAETYLDSESSDVPADISEQANAFCMSKFKTFVGLTYEESTLGFSSIYPTSDSWAQGDKELTCLIGADATISTSLKNSKL